MPSRYTARGIGWGCPVTVIFDGRSLHIERLLETWHIYKHGHVVGSAWHVELENGRRLVVRSDLASGGGWSTYLPATALHSRGLIEESPTAIPERPQPRIAHCGQANQ